MVRRERTTDPARWVANGGPALAIAIADLETWPGKT
jgi:hypothetical protein